MARALMNYFKDNREVMIDFLKKLVTFETPSRDKASQDKIFDFLEMKFKELEFYTIRVKGNQTGGYLYARPKFKKKNEPVQLLIGHCDTVWALNTLRELPITAQNGKTTGPGIYDMKAGLTQIYFALKATRSMSLDLPALPTILINSDEEIGSVESTATIKRLSKIANRAYVMEPPLGLDGKLKTARKGIGRFIITVKGKAAHAGLDPKKGVNAIVELSHQVQQLYAMNNFDKGITVNVGLIEGGQSANVVAAGSRAVIDVRVLNKKDGEYITKKIHSLEPMLDEVELFIEGGIGRPPMERTARNQKLWRLAQEKARSIGLNLEQACAGGGSDGNTTSLYTATLDGLGTVGDGAHATHEFIFTETLLERTALLTLLLAEDVLKN